MNVHVHVQCILRKGNAYMYMYIVHAVLEKKTPELPWTIHVHVHVYLLLKCLVLLHAGHVSHVIIQSVNPLTMTMKMHTLNSTPWYQTL